MCETSNNSNIETATLKNLGPSLPEETSKLKMLLSSANIKQKVKQIKEIIGERTQSGVSSTLITPEDSR